MVPTGSDMVTSEPRQAFLAWSLEKQNKQNKPKKQQVDLMGTLNSLSS